MTIDNARENLTWAVNEKRWEDATLACLTLADIVAFRSAEGALVHVQQAAVYASLHHTQTIEWLADRAR